MTCIECRKHIDVSKEDFEEAGSCQFIHTKCQDAVLDAAAKRAEEAETQEFEILKEQSV